MIFYIHDIIINISKICPNAFHLLNNSYHLNSKANTLAILSLNRSKFYYYKHPELNLYFYVMAILFQLIGVLLINHSISYLSNLRMLKLNVTQSFSLYHFLKESFLLKQYLNLFQTQLFQNFKEKQVNQFIWAISFHFS